MDTTDGNARRFARSAGFAAVVLVAAMQSVSAVAALSPYWETAAEIKAILSDGRIADALKSQDPIQSVTHTDTDVYEVSNGTCTVTVNVVDKPKDPSKPMMVGPRQFDLQIGDAKCQ